MISNIKECLALGNSFKRGHVSSACLEAWAGRNIKDSIFYVNPAHSRLWVNPFLFYRYNSGTHRIPSQLDSNLDSNRLDCPLMRPSHR
jgi:hypothetical protein